MGCCDLLDSDGDGLPDNVELSGYLITIILANGDTIQRHVTSDPFLRDTDGDTVSDLDELRELSDPRSIDTDGDQLTDEEEFAIFASLFNTDTDGDGIFDGWEFHTFKTDALVADTDGDGLDDPRELFEMNRNPRIADLPDLRVDLGQVRLLIDERYTFTDDRGETSSVESSSNATLDTETTASRTDTRLNTTSATTGIDVTAGFEAGMEHEFGFGGGTTVSFGVSGEFGYHRKNTTENHKMVEENSASRTTQVFEQSLNKGREFARSRSVSREVFGARIDIDLEVFNPSDLAFRAENLEVSMLVTDPNDRTRLLPVATLVPASTLETGEELVLNLAPGQRLGPLIFSNREVVPSLVEDLMRQPRGIVLRVANVDITDELGRNLAFAIQSVRERTAAIDIDRGDGLPETLLVSTNATIDEEGILGVPGAFLGGLDARGLQVGVPLEFLLRDVLRLEKNADPNQPDGIIAGENLIADSFAEGDDIQIVPAGTAGVPPNTKIIDAGPNGFLDTRVAGRSDDGTACVSDCPSSFCNSVDMMCAGGPRKDDPCDLPCDNEDYLTGVCVGGPDAGQPCSPSGDLTCGTDEPEVGFCLPRDEAIVIRGYGTSPTCSADTLQQIVDGGNLVSDTTVDTNSDDVQVVVEGQPTSIGGVVVGPGLDGFIDTIPGGDDLVSGPGNPCADDSDCPDGTCDGRETLVRVGGRKSDQFRRFWAILVSDEQLGADFASISLRAGESLGLAFVQDIDRDGLLAREENQFGSSDTNPDTDADGLDDFAEIREGWDVGVVGSDLRHVFPDPRKPDTDGDGLRDDEELSLADLGLDPTDFGLASTDPIATDPTLSDTDGDGIGDSDEAFGFIAGGGIFDPLNVIVVGDDNVADTVACGGIACTGGQNIGGPCNLFRADRDCPDTSTDGDVCNSGENAGLPCSSDGDCAGAATCTGLASGLCVAAIDPCDDLQLVPFGTPGLPSSLAVIAPGEDGDLETMPETTDGLDVLVSMGDLEGSSDGGGDDQQVVLKGDPVTDFDLPLGPDSGGVIIRPGPDGIIQSVAGGDDAVMLGRFVAFTDPLNPDTDFDQVDDGFELRLGSHPRIRDADDFADQDEDGLTDDEETRIGWDIEVETEEEGAVAGRVTSNPSLPDTDLDGLPDLLERLIASDPRAKDTDGDLISDFDEFDDFERFTEFNEFFPGFFVDGTTSARHGTNPNLWDTDGDGLSDFLELFVGWTVRPGSAAPYQVFSDPLAFDTDGDGLNDQEELGGADGFVPCETLGLFCAFDPSLPCCGDQNDATDPTLGDTDGDGSTDAAEIALGSNPLNPDLGVIVRLIEIQPLIGNRIPENNQDDIKLNNSVKP